MNWRILEVLYREMAYKRLKANPQLSADWEKLSKTFKRRGSLKKTLLTQSLLFVMMGFILLPAVYYTKDPLGSAVIYATYCMIPLIMALYGTAVTSQYAVSLGLFEPLLPLPIEVGGGYLSALLLITELPAVLFLLPPAVALALRVGPITGLLGFLWALLGAFMGHTFGLLIYDRFGKASSGRFSGLKTALKAVGILLVMSLFYGLNYFQRYVLNHYGTLKGVFQRYSIAYPFSVATIERPLLSLALLTTYAVVFGLVYYHLVRHLWERITEGEGSTSTGGGRLSLHSPALTLALKDFRIASRNTSLLTGLLMPVVIVMPSTIRALNSGNGAVAFVLALSWTSAISVDAVLKIDGRAFEVLHSLPLSLKTFLRGKLLTMTAVPLSTGVALSLVLSLKVPHALTVLPLAVLLPVATAGTTLAVFYHGIREVALPQTTWKKMLLALVFNGVIVGTTAGLWYFKWFLAILLVILIDALVLWNLSR